MLACGCSEHLEEAVQIWNDVVCIMAVNEALPTVMNEPAVDVGAPLFITPVVLLPAPDTHTSTNV